MGLTSKKIAILGDHKRYHGHTSDFIFSVRTFSLLGEKGDSLSVRTFSLLGEKGEGVVFSI